ncbi:MAG: hypothetical protein EB060_07820 [Proteobacteria bacterium]|nr:hypothetical protein [Pseudomonadota bacterium]
MYNEVSQVSTPRPSGPIALETMTEATKEREADIKNVSAEFLALLRMLKASGGRIFLKTVSNHQLYLRLIWG